MKNPALSCERTGFLKPQESERRTILASHPCFLLQANFEFILHRFVLGAPDCTCSRPLGAALAFGEGAGLPDANHVLAGKGGKFFLSPARAV